mmetsp:Transcript_20539/g.32310  ORF Transcript_20539/g.32310 Transcript_20539/m.32310 type:complete len:220 (+) Transcript_20539:1061-1720(+)
MALICIPKKLFKPKHSHCLPSYISHIFDDTQLASQRRDEKKTAYQNTSLTLQLLKLAKKSSPLVTFTFAELPELGAACSCGVANCASPTFPDDGAALLGAPPMPPPPEPTPPSMPLPMPPPPPNLAAMRAFASSRNRVCRITYCSSLSPESRSMPLGSSPGPGMASPKVEADMPGAAGAAAGGIVTPAPTRPAPPPIPPLTLSLPNPLYLPLGAVLLCE